MNYTIYIKPKAKKQLLLLMKNDRDRIVKIIDALENNPFPHHCLKLEGYDSYFRIRTGNFRIVYSVAEKHLIVEIIKIGHRKDIYRGK